MIAGAYDLYSSVSKVLGPNAINALNPFLSRDTGHLHIYLVRFTKTYYHLIFFLLEVSMFLYVLLIISS